MLDNGRRQRAEKAASALRAAAIVSGIGITMAASVAVGALGGSWLDRHLGTDPWLTVVGFLLGSVGGFLEMLRMVAMTGGGKKRRS